MIRPPALVLLLVALLPRLYAGTTNDPALRVNGRVVDAVTRTPIADAILTTGDKELRSDPHVPPAAPGVSRLCLRRPPVHGGRNQSPDQSRRRLWRQRMDALESAQPILGCRSEAVNRDILGLFAWYHE
jgi:hypothetical protein